MIPWSLSPAAGSRGSALALAVLLCLPAAAAAQTFSGSGAGATPLFVLSSGTTVVSVQSTDDAFTAFLLATDGSVVEQLSAAPRQDVRVPEDGRYLFEVRTAGVWSISIEGPDSTRILAIRGRIEGAQAAGGSPPAGWLAKGLGAGLVLGPIGTLFVTQRAGRADLHTDAAIERRLADAPPTYAAAFREAYGDRLRGNRRTAALVGGVTGTAILGFVILQLTVWDEEPSSTGQPPGNGENAAVIELGSIPLPW